MIHIYRTALEVEKPRECAILEKILKTNAIGPGTDCNNSFTIRTEICFNIELVKGLIRKLKRARKIKYALSRKI